MDNGWESSAGAWIADMGEAGDFGRKYVLDPVMVPLALKRAPQRALDVGCGEGRFCRMLRSHRVDVTGVDPTPSLIRAAQQRDRGGKYIQGGAERLPFREASFDLVISYLSLIDIPDIRTAIPEMARVLKPGGSLLIANLNSFNTAGMEIGWMTDMAGRRILYPVDRYLEERSCWIEYRGIRVLNHHRPLSTYLQLLLGAGLQLTHFDEPAPSGNVSHGRAEKYRRAPWFCVMEWEKQG